jgi:outer membrane lipopolysaccharide assembly protein LptE/RlpB
MSRLTLALLVTLALGLAACGATLSDPLAIQPMLERCKAQADRGERPREFFPMPVLPVLGCR